MKYHKIILAGGNGYMGTVFADYYSALADEVLILARSPKPAKGNIQTLVWNGVTPGNWVKEMESADLLINLCGKNVNCRYTKANKAEILSSRINPTVLLGNVIGTLQEPPKLWINITSATIYRHAEDRPQDEENGEIGYGFSVDVCKGWENAFFDTYTPQTRKVALRMGIVLGGSDGVFPRLLNLVRFGLGGKQGNGKQYVSWVHERDAARCTEWLLQHPELNGIINCTAPGPVKNEILMSTINRLYGALVGLPAPAWFLAIGALLIGTETELILKSRWVLPKRLMDSGYSFLFPEVKIAIKDIFDICKLNLNA